MQPYWVGKRIEHINSLHTGYFNAFLSSAELIQNLLFEKYLSGIPWEFQTVCTLIRPDNSSCLMWVQTVNQGNQPFICAISNRPISSILCHANRKAQASITPYFFFFQVNFVVNGKTRINDDCICIKII